MQILGIYILNKFISFLFMKTKQRLLNRVCLHCCPSDLSTCMLKFWSAYSTWKHYWWHWKITNETPFPRPISNLHFTNEINSLEKSVLHRKWQAACLNNLAWGIFGSIFPQCLYGVAQNEGLQWQMFIEIRYCIIIQE